MAPKNFHKKNSAKEKNRFSSSPLQHGMKMSDVILIFGGATLTALIVVTGLLEVVLYGSWRSFKTEDLKGAAPTVVEVTDLVNEKTHDTNFIEDYKANVETDADVKAGVTQQAQNLPDEKNQGDVYIVTNEVKSSGVQGAKDVLLFDAAISSHQNGTLRNLVFHSDGFARPYDVASMQLYVNEKFVAEAPVFEGKAEFSSLQIEIEPGEQLFIKVRGNMSVDALAGDRLEIGFTSSSDVELKNDEGGILSIGGKFPIWGGYVSVIGKKL